MDRSPSATPQFCEIYEQHVDAIRRYCYRRLPSSDVDDATAEVFLVVWRRLEHDPGGDGTQLWLYGIARNVVRNHSRSGRRLLRLRGRLATTAARSTEDVALQVVRRVEEQDVLDCLAVLRPSDQEVLRLADRLYVLFQGRLNEIPKEDWTTEKLGLAMLGAEEGAGS